MGALDEFTINLVARARRGELDPVVGREPEIRRTLQILGRRRKNNPVLIGHPGVGKTAIDEGIALRRFQPIRVAEPTGDDALVILRGIKDRYEAHHGVRIEDAALRAAVTIAQEHILDRYLPDKAIDLIDEAASQLKLELESVPEEVAVAEENLVRLQIELRALRGDPATAPQRLDEVAERARICQRRVEWLNSDWQMQKQTIAEIRELLARENQLRAEEERARRTGDLDRAAAIAYTDLPSMSRRIEALEDQLRSSDEGGASLRDAVTADDVIAVAAAWTGVASEDLGEL